MTLAGAANPEPAGPGSDDGAPEAGGTAAAQATIAPEDRVTYAEAAAITGRSHHYLRKQAQLGHLSRDGGQAADAFTTWLSRTDCEQLALQLYRRGHATEYWLTIAKAAEMLGIARQHAHKARHQGRLPAHQVPRTGDWLVRRHDVMALVFTKAFRGRRQVR